MEYVIAHDAIWYINVTIVLNPIRAGIDLARQNQILTTKVDPRTEKVKYY